MEFIVIKTAKKDGKKVKKDIDEQFCNAKNPLAGSFCLLKNRGFEAFIFVPMRWPMGMPRVMLKMIIKGLKSSLKEFALEVLDIKKTIYKKDDLEKEYNEAVKKLVS